MPLDVYLVHHPEEDEHAFSVLLPERHLDSLEADEAVESAKTYAAESNKPTDEDDWMHKD